MVSKNDIRKMGADAIGRKYDQDLLEAFLIVNKEAKAHEALGHPKECWCYIGHKNFNIIWTVPNHSRYRTWDCFAQQEEDVAAKQKELDAWDVRICDGSAQGKFTDDTVTYTVLATKDY